MKRKTVEHQRAEAEEKRARSEEFTRENIREAVGLGIMNGGLFGVVVGFFMSCSVQNLSVDRVTFVITVVLFAGIGALIGLAVGYLLES